MAIWQVVVAYLAVFLFLQVVVYRYLRDDDGRGTAGLWSRSNPEGRALEDRKPESTTGSDRRSADPATEPGQFDPREGLEDAERESRRGGKAECPPAERRVRPDDEQGARFCPACGARNEPEPAFSYCRNCASPLR